MNATEVPIYVIVEHGRVWEIKNIPDNIEIQVIDKDVESASKTISKFARTLRLVARSKAG